MDFEKRPARPPAEAPRAAHAQPSQQQEGCLTAFVRIPVRIVVLVLVVPVRVVWDLLRAGGAPVRRRTRKFGRWLHGALLAPLGDALRWLGRAVFVAPWAALYRWVLTPLGHGLRRLGSLLRAGLVWCVLRLLVAPVARLYGALLTPLGHGLRWLARKVGATLLAGGRGARAVVAWCVRTLLVAPAVALYRHVLTPFGHGLRWCARVLVAVPAAWLYRTVLTPAGHGLARAARGFGRAVGWCVTTLLVRPVVWLGREAGAALGICWQVAGHVSRALGRGAVWLARNLVGRPLRRAYRGVLTPLGHWVRDEVWRPVRGAVREAAGTTREVLRAARASVRETRRSVWRALAGGGATDTPAVPPASPAVTVTAAAAPKTEAVK
jgi:hypothetical protein